MSTRIMNPNLRADLSRWAMRLDDVDAVVITPEIRADYSARIERNRQRRESARIEQAIADLSGWDGNDETA